MLLFVVATVLATMVVGIAAAAVDIVVAAVGDVIGEEIEDQ